MYLLLLVFVVFSFQVSALDFQSPALTNAQRDHVNWISSWVEIRHTSPNPFAYGEYFSIAWTKEDIEQEAVQNPRWGHVTMLETDEFAYLNDVNLVGRFYYGAPNVIHSQFHIFAKMQFPPDLSDGPDIWQKNISIEIKPNQIKYSDPSITLADALKKAKEDPEIQYFVFLVTDGEIGRAQFFKDPLPVRTSNPQLLYKGPLKRF